MWVGIDRDYSARRVTLLRPTTDLRSQHSANDRVRLSLFSSLAKRLVEKLKTTPREGLHL